MSPEEIYDLHDVDLPRLAGRALAIFAAAVENPATRGPLLNRLIKDAGIEELRQAVVDESPTPHPLANRSGRTSADQIDQETLLDRAAALPPADSTGFHFSTVRDYADAYRSGKTTPRQIAERFLALLRGEAGALNAFISVRPDDLLAQADAATARWQAGEPRSLFDGVPVAVKDELDQKGHPTTVGTAFLGTTPAGADATAAARMRALGALLLGKTNMHEIGIGVTGLNPHHGVVRTPYNIAHHSGGSSSGSGAAVGAGLCPVAIGADGGGSIRIPAAFCGVFGLKASYGRISAAGAAPLDWSVGHIGPLAGTAHDLALAYAALAGPDPADNLTLFQPPPDVDAAGERDLSGVRIGVFRPWFEHADEVIVRACDEMLDALQAQGATVEEVVIPDLNLMRLAHVVTISTEMATALQRYDAEHRSDYGRDVRLNLAVARAFTARDYVQAQRVRTRAMATLDGLLAEVDVIATPATAIAAPRIRDEALPDGESDLTTLTKIMRYMVQGNLTGLPALVAPAGYTNDGRSIGLQLIGRYWDEATLLRLAFAVESALERKAPQLDATLL